MSRTYEELPCGCLVSENGLIPCEASGMFDLEPTQHNPQDVELHNKSHAERDNHEQAHLQDR
jgi:hypothetical protein